MSQTEVQRNVCLRSSKRELASFVGHINFTSSANMKQREMIETGRSLINIRTENKTLGNSAGNWQLRGELVSSSCPQQALSVNGCHPFAQYGDSLSASSLPKRIRWSIMSNAFESSKKNVNNTLLIVKQCGDIVLLTKHAR